MNISLLKELLKIEDLLAWAKDCVIKINNNFLNIKNREDLREVDVFREIITSTLVVTNGSTLNISDIERINKKLEPGTMIFIASCFVQASGSPTGNIILKVVNSNGSIEFASLSFAPPLTYQQYTIFSIINFKTLDNIKVLCQNNSGVSVNVSNRQFLLWRIK